jgi:hypothetical protein
MDRAMRRRSLFVSVFLGCPCTAFIARAAPRAMPGGAEAEKASDTKTPQAGPKLRPFLTQY